MKRLLLLSLVFVSAVSFADEWVNGYYKSNGTYVQGHYRTKKNRTTLDNYSTKGNYNPYTGKRGTRNTYETTPSIYNNFYNNKTKQYKRKKCYSILGCD